MPFIFGSFEVDDLDAQKAALAFDDACLASYDFGGTSSADNVDFADIGRMIGSRMVGMYAHEAAALIQLGQSAPWHAVPIDARLEDAAPGTTSFDAAMDLWSHFKSIKGINVAKATKLLAMKRQSLFPVVDDRVMTLYKIAAQQHRGVSFPTVVAIREDILAAQTAPALTALRSFLIADASPKARRLAQLTALRLRDVVLWQRWEIVGAPPPAPPWPNRIAW